MGGLTKAARSHLYVPADQAEVLARAVDRGADALLVDLEDAVAPAAKDAARATAATFLTGLPPAGSAHPQIWVRINPGKEATADLDAVVGPALSGICLAKTEGADDVAVVAERLDALERQRGIPSGSIAISPLLESPRAVLDAARIAAAPRVVRLQLGEADLCAAAGLEPGVDEQELLWVRSQVVLVSAAAGIEAPVGPVSTDYRDLAALRVSTAALKRLGFRSRACIHPAQLPIVHEVFTPSEGELARARALIARFDAASAQGNGILTDVDGRMVDLAVVRAARRTVALEP